MDRETITKSVEKERNNGGGISRRSFLKGVGGVAAAAAVLGVSGLKSKALAQPIPAYSALPKEKLLEAYLRMQRIRQGELKLREIFLTGDQLKRFLPRGTGHTSAGEEATCVGVAMAMEKGDYLTGSHRSHGYPLAMGLDMRRWMAELFGKVGGSNKGHGGSLHIAEPAMGILGMSGIVGAGVPQAVGAAWAAKLQGNNKVAISTCGDGAMNTSGFNASLNLAAIQNLPVVFVINNNQWEVRIPARWVQALTRAQKDLSVRAAGFAIPGITVDGNDLFTVYKGAKYCIDRAREGKGPSMLECLTYRRWQHSGPKEHEITQWPFNDRAELEYWLRRDPVKRFEKIATEGLLTEEELVRVQKQVAIELEDAIEFAVESPWPNPKEDFKYYEKVFWT